jgi:phosphoribosylformylglycinamidine cyclo-ligase
MKKVTYRQAGVDIDKADNLIKGIKKTVATTRIKGCMDSLGGFGAFFDIEKTGIKNPLLIASTDGVGTKLKLAIDCDKHDTVGIDLVAMCVNDCLCSGAKPIFFLDYFAIGKLDSRIWKNVLKGIVKGCRQAGCALIGGETAEMPGMYSKGDYDLAGFCVGVVDKKKVIDGKKIKQGDVLLGIASSGLHSNGYSLVRKIFTKKELKENKAKFLKPTEIYIKPVLEIIGKGKVKGVSHITGGGFFDNIPRCLPRGVTAVMHKGSWKEPLVYDLIRKKSKLPDKELYRTFNMGIGMVLVMKPGDVAGAQKILKKHKLNSWKIGEVKNGNGRVKLV